MEELMPAATFTKRASIQRASHNQIELQRKAEAAG
jgi:hypothetical protein